MLKEAPRKVSAHDVGSSLTADVSHDVTPPSVHKISDVNWVLTFLQTSLLFCFDNVFPSNYIIFRKLKRFD